MAESEIKVYGITWCPDCKQAKKFLGEQRVQYLWIDVEQEPEGLRYVQEVNNGKQIVPTIVFQDGSILVEPSNAQLAEKLGLQTKAKSPYYDLIVVGGGPAGLTAAIYAAREGLETLVIERAGFGGQAGSTEHIENFPGFPEGINGDGFAQRLVAQSKKFGVERLSAQEVREISSMGQHRLVKTQSGDEYCAAALLLTPGSTYRRLDVPGEEEFIGAGIHFCATCDGPLYKGQEMLVVGGGNSGIEEGLFLTKFATKIPVLERDPQLRASKILQDKALSHPKMEIFTSHTVRSFKGDTRMRSVVVEDLASGKQKEMTPGAAFIFVGLLPNTPFIKGLVELDQWGYILTSKTLETNIPGVFAAGDARAGSTKQIASAAGEGATASLMIREYLKGR